MAISPIQKIHKSIESSKQRMQKRKDANDLRNAGVYANGCDRYLDENGYPRDGIEIPVWFKNLSKAWQSNSKKGTRPKDTIPKSWDEWCDDRVDLIGIDPRKAKRPVGRPKLPAHLKKNPTKAKRSDQMRAILLEHNIHLFSKPSNDGPWEDIFLKEHPEWQFLSNGRLRHRDEPPISIHRFLQDHNLIPM